MKARRHHRHPLEQVVKFGGAKKPRVNLTKSGSFAVLYLHVGVSYERYG
jgi:hypothetical protein